MYTIPPSPSLFNEVKHPSPENTVALLEGRSSHHKWPNQDTSSQASPVACHLVTLDPIKLKIVIYHHSV